jgi:predicted TIM-barrel fold metal-dependent hydrolase
MPRAQCVVLFGVRAETALVMMRLIMSDAFDVFPKLRIVLGHYA